jgi:hypothetical protein
MYNNDNQQNFVSQMPVKPYCSDDLSTGLRIRKKEKALEMLYIQANQPAIQTCLLFDLDDDNCFYKFEDVASSTPLHNEKPELWKMPLWIHTSERSV